MFKTAADYIEAANNADELTLVEQCFTGWCKQIEQVIMGTNLNFTKQIEQVLINFTKMEQHPY